MFCTKNKTMSQINTLNSWISCVTSILIFVLKHLWRNNFKILEINITTIFVGLWKSQTTKTKQRSEYSAQYHAKRTRSYHEQAMIRQQIYDNILARKSGVDYNPRIFLGNFPAKRNNKSARKIQWSKKILGGEPL